MTRDVLDILLRGALGVAVLTAAVTRLAAEEASAAGVYASLPVAVSSFGAVEADGWLYIYGGHVARTHSYSTEAVSKRFDRLNLADGTTWQQLAGGPGIQGMNLASHGGKIYRVGGMEPRNKPGEKADNHSLADCQRFDPDSGQWTALAPLPEGRSSHDVAVIGDTLYVIGGWSMHGEQGGEDWPDTMLALDLSSPSAGWRTIKQPFERRALIVAVLAGKLYVLGGFNEESEPSRRVEIYDPATDQWSQGPELPGEDQNGFAPAACAHRGHLYASVADGTLYRLNEQSDGWEKAASTTPRIVHRLVSYGPKILVIGGAAKGDNFDLIEAVTIE